MPLELRNYVFNKTEGSVTFPNYRLMELSGFDTITNTTAGIIIYDSNDPSKSGHVVNNKLLLDYDTTSMNNTDVLFILYNPSGGQATQEQVDAGESATRYITPKTFHNSSKITGLNNAIQIFELELIRKTTGNSYSEITRVDGVVTKEEFYSDEAKTNKIFTKEIIYNISGYPETITTTDHITSKTMVETITWNIDEVATYFKIVS